MALIHSPRIVTDGLILCLDAANPKSYPGSGTTWTDLSGRGNNGTLTNGPTYSSANGGSLVFDGINDYVNTTNIQFERTDPFTMISWIYVTTANSQIINNENASYRGYQFAFNSDGYLSFLLRNAVSSNNINVRTSNTLNLNTWLYVSTTYTGSSLASGVTLYVNGISMQVVVISDNLSATTISNETTWIGQRRPSTQGPLAGNISQVSIYNRALTAQEVQQNFNATRGRYGI